MRVLTPTQSCFVSIFMIAAAFCEEPPGRDAVSSSFPILSGVGIALEESEGLIRVSKVLPNSAAEESRGIRVGDEIVSVQNGRHVVRVRRKTVGEVVSLIRGAVGSSVTIELRPTGQKHSSKLTLTRKPIRITGVPELSYREFVGKKAPELVFKVLADAEKVKLSNYRGRITVLELWATWCGACMKPVEDLQTLAASHPEWKESVAFLTVSVDSKAETALRMVKENRWTQTTHLSIDPRDLESIGIHVLPVSVLISRDGTIVAMGESHALHIEEQVRALLALNHRSNRE